MHYALLDSKRLLRHESRYRVGAMTPNERLKIARQNAGYATTVDAAAALGMPQSTYAGHENGLRGFPASRAPSYARKFKVTEEWLLYGKGAATISEEAEIIETAEFMRRMTDPSRKAVRDVARRLAGLDETGT